MKHRRLLLLLALLILSFINDCESIQRIQRRFMWKQVDDTMDGIIDSMASSARAMKSMISEFIPAMTTAPTLPIHSNILDYLPSETTKVKYVIRNTSAKPMKIIKMSAPKKVVKIMTVPKPIIESRHQHSGLHMPSPEALRQMEKEQEMIAEGRLPSKSNVNEHGNIVNGQINEFGGDWKPISTVKPYVMSELHTTITGEPLPEPEKQIYEAENDVATTHFDVRKRKPTYEVTEHTPEETVAVPYTQQYQNSRGFVPIRASHTQQTARISIPSASTTIEAPNYPAAFLKKQRERPHNSGDSVLSTVESFVNNKHKLLQTNKLRTKSESWPMPGPTLLPTSIELSTAAKLRKAEPIAQPTNDERLRPKQLKKEKNSMPRDIRQRGSIKFGDKLSELYK